MTQILLELWVQNIEFTGGGGELYGFILDSYSSQPEIRKTILYSLITFKFHNCL